MSKKLFRITCISFLTIVLLANSKNGLLVLSPENIPGTSYLEPSAQRGGDPSVGYNYLIYGDYISSGIPLGIYRRGTKDSPHDLGRSGDNKGIPFQFNVITTADSAKLVVPTCLTCHAEFLNGRLVVGLGNNTDDHTRNEPGRFQMAAMAISMQYGKKSPEWAGFAPVNKAQKAVGEYILTAVRGVNPADKIFASLAAHRDAVDLRWLDEPQFDVPKEVIPTDVPAWWLMKKKNALYYNGLGRGDFARLVSASGMLTMRDSAEARRVDARFPDLIAWIRTLEPPKYPYPIDRELAAAGKKIFEKTCYKCHGAYGDSVSYPNLLVSLEKVGTDPLLSMAYQKYPEYSTWYNNSWYGQGPNKGQLLPNDGYVAPPLDGIWATAPYLHNASVPTLEDLLNSPQRPVYWKRSFSNTEANYDKAKVGWKYAVETSKTDSETYDTTLPGYGNGGHRFGDKLTAEEREAVIEYLKTL